MHQPCLRVVFNCHYPFLFYSKAIFMPSGVMAQQSALLIHFNNTASSNSTSTYPKERSFVCHYTSHILLHEKDTCDHLLNMRPIVIPRQENSVAQQPISYQDIHNLIHTATAQSAPSPLPCAVVLECPHREIGGKLTTYEDLENVSAECRKFGIALHMDGARLWEAISHYCDGSCLSSSTGKPVTVTDLCALFDSIYVSCYKGIGGMTGAVLLGSAPFIAESRLWLRRFGGNTYTLLPFAVSSYSSFMRYVAWNFGPTSEDKVKVASAAPSSVRPPVAYSMRARLQRMQEVAALLTNTFLGTAAYPAPETRLFRFDPEVPQVPVNTNMFFFLTLSLKVLRFYSVVWC
jgi:hypothetical protein